jgi:3-hydroxybutyryl-CoA dehydrogenase
MGSGVRKVGVIGVGLMGSGIAQVAAARSFDPLAIDSTPEYVEKGTRRIRESLNMSLSYSYAFLA